MEGKLNQLFENYLNHQCSDQEILTLLEYFKIEQQESALRELIMQELQRSGEPNIRVDRVEERLNLAYAGIREYIIQEDAPVIRKIKLWKRIAVAAAIATVISGGALYYYNLNFSKEQPAETAYKIDAGPGRIGATLTLADGKQINLSDAANGELAKEAGVVITKAENGQLTYQIKGESLTSNKVNTLTTAKGETYRVRLPDGSLIWLNAASTLKYPSSFANLKDRRVELSGEAYFEISKDKEHPFLVQSRGQTVKVLGTRFNINSYLNEPATATTLLEGSIIFVSGDQSTRLIPGEQILASKEGITIKKNVNIDNIIDWQSGDFNFDGVKLKAALRKLERWYNIEFVLGDSINDEMEAGGWISRKNNLSAVLKLISKSHQVKFRLDQNKVYVSSE